MEYFLFSLEPYKKEFFFSYTFNYDYSLISDWLINCNKVKQLNQEKISFFTIPLNDKNYNEKNSFIKFNLCKNLEVICKTIETNSDKISKVLKSKLISINGKDVKRSNNFYIIIGIFFNTIEKNSIVIVEKNFRLKDQYRKEIYSTSLNFCQTLTGYLNSLNSNLFIIESILINRSFIEIYKILMKLNVMNQNKFFIKVKINKEGIIIKKKYENKIIQYSLIKISQNSTFLEIKKIIKNKNNIMVLSEQYKEIKFVIIFLEKLRKLLESHTLEI